MGTTVNLPSESIKIFKMKKILLAGAVALFGLSNAQIAKGTTYVSGQLGILKMKITIQILKSRASKFFQL